MSRYYQADTPGKLHAIEQIDRHIVGPLLVHFRGGDDDWRIMVLPDHPTPVRLRDHTSEPVPFAIAGKGIPSVVARPFCEAAAAGSDFHIAHGCELMEYFLKVK